MDVGGSMDSQSERWGLYVALGSNLACLLVYLAVFSISTCAPVRSCAQLGSAAAAKFHVWLDMVRQYCASRESESAFDRKVRVLAAEARVQRLRNACPYGVHICGALSICTMLLFSYYDPAKWQDSYRIWWELHQSPFALLTLTFMMAMFGWLWPSRIRGTTLNIYHTVVFARLCWQCGTCESVYQLFASDHLSVGVRFFAAVTVGKPAFTFGINVAYSILKVAVVSKLYAALSSEENDFVNQYWGGEYTYVINEMFLFMALWCVSAVVDAWNFSSVRANLKAQTLSTSEVTVKAILVVLCDAVVTVDKDLAFCSDAMEIASFLVRSPLNSSYKGVSLLELVEEDDRERVRERITTAQMGHGTTLSLSARLIDGNGNPLNVQMYCTCFIDISDCRAYVIGILEVKDSMYDNQRQDTLAINCYEEAWNGIRGSGALHSASEPDRDSFVSVETEESVNVPLMSDADGMEIWVDIAEPSGSMPVVNTNFSARAIGGPHSVVGVSFLEWLRPNNAAEVVTSIAAAWDRFQEGVENSQAPDLGWWHLRPPHAMRAGLEYKARMTLDLTRVVRNDVFDAQICICICCEDIGVQKLKRNQMKKKKNRKALNVPVHCDSDAQRIEAAPVSINGDSQGKQYL
eukprot:TRINITY_DN50963_c1_g1_i1.p1 TRINITY_DN50963_c1_g1~~TRINITY_DN50963_c1_g1_i1.p1  ORF type:complete len:633 (-),score=93.18 TRINITY_DN50963_c1_g1_i1:367-2265(-)